MDLTVDPVLIGLQITITGVIVVFSALAMVALTLVALGQLNRFQGKSKSKAASELATTKVASALPKPAAALPDGQITPELIALISAAAAEALGRPVRVTRVEYDRRPGADAWGRHGRITIMDSRRRR
ncbi:OadG family protein [Candidatus Viridilinea mediisalina]|uniref:Oxaloacetate decarboxylase gamma chain n=1 Tax=Candidatus Viridilinea mediisalina TaxID=2024553 RepID=A0A2A6RER2_9CHLR|nr:OadG family protein [Candidatus Viridilinea mediisalina]PDW01614.1 hypothetical protein CJ255_18235 [Candidatus Viridilinea mediisalina]